ncbi:interferon-induced very large GTPase 1-like [Dendronephthya gigantea]|uniref:interferon-induced very large GTPase 1-like n=1 Tax=Dendronephthya gigantea TaxID=151771 RepID=UPI00106B9F92|nr:interferon-induced very large GTPase 1-like [Dendronephthya gigantea]
MIGNYQVREFKLKAQNLNKSNNDSDSKESEHEEFQEDDVNPMDAILDLFQRSDDSLRRYLVNKLSACQLSVPFLLPDPEAPFENVTILLSALENITKCWKDGTCTKQVFATEHPFPVVSFIRIGKVTISKSMLINKIMSDGDSYHDYFFHRNMQGGDIERKQIDGLVELSWFLPGRSENQTLKQEICLANLRGDARRFKKQLDVLLTLSSALCILLASDYRDVEMCSETVPIDCLEKVASQFKGNIILIFYEKITPASAKEYFDDIKNTHQEKLSLIAQGKNIQEDRFYQRIREHIQKSINEQEASPLVELVPDLVECDIHPPNVSRQLEFRWLEVEIENAENLLKLQQHIPKLAELERRKYRLSRNSTESDYMIKIKEDIAKEVMAQKETFQQLDEQLIHFLNDITTMDETERNYTLHKLKHHFEKISVQAMAKIPNKSEALIELPKEKKEAPQGFDVQPNLNHLQSKTKRSFGLEHINRELAQLYQLGESKYDYAGAAADMLLSGYPLEILDGDSFYIPLEWFNAVYTRLEKKTNNAKIFVISVIGLQNSGKCTMLNTMFGLESPVNTTRSTHGAFASLIPVGDSLKFDSKFDYVLIIDTEGLGETEDTLMREDDNALALFAIGVADLTIVNVISQNQTTIFGIVELLEIAVNAFLKNNLLTEKKKIFCVVVHQNAAAADPGDKFTMKPFNFLKKHLDRCIQECCGPKFPIFDDIISFDLNEDVFDMPSLPRESQPIAPINPEYRRAVQMLKENIMKRMCLKESLKLSISQFRERVCNLWEDALTENSLRNSFRAYLSLNSKYFHEFVKFVVIEMKELQVGIEIALEECKTEEEREEKLKKSKEQVEGKAKKLEDDIKETMDEFLKTSEHRAILEKWREKLMRDIEYQTTEKVSEVNKHCTSTLNYARNLQDIKQKKIICQKNLREKAKNLVKSAHNEEKLIKDDLFKGEWQKLNRSVPENNVEMLNVEKEINDEMVNVLCMDPVLNEKMKEKIQQQGYNISNFKESAPIIHDDQLIYNFGDDQLAFEENSEKIKQQCCFSARRIQKFAEENGRDFAKKTLRSESYTHARENLIQMYQKVISTIDEETMETLFKFGNSLKCDTLLNSFANNRKTFVEREERFRQKRDIGTEVAALKPELNTYFENIFTNTKKEISAADSLVKDLETSIKSTLNDTMGQTIADEMLKESMYKSKSHFHAYVLIELGEKCTFESYKPYLENPASFLKTKLEKTMQEYSRTSTLREEKIEYLRQEILQAIGNANKETRTESKKPLIWIQSFEEQCHQILNINKETFAKGVKEIAKEDLEEFYVFQNEVQDKIEESIRNLIKCSLDPETILNWNLSASDVLLGKIMGCQSVCPFCKALCDKDHENHQEKHSALFHRPQGITGSKDKKTRKLRTNICQKNVASNKKFSNPDIPGRQHRYKDFQSVNDYYKSWLIPGNKSSKTPKYFKWFMATFSQDLAAHYNAREPKVPRAWKRVTFKKAKAKLQRQYKLPNTR